MFYNNLHKKNLFTHLMVLTGLIILFSWAGTSTAFAQDPVTVPATLVRATDTSLFSTPSSDPSGLTYLPSSGWLLISDGEVEEPPLLGNANLFATTLSGSLVYTASTLSFSDEPAGVAYNPSNGHLFFGDDVGPRGVYELNPGPDGLYHTSDDIVTFAYCSAWGCLDPEGVAYDSLRGHLLVMSEIDEEVFDIAPGANGIFDGVDDQVTHFDTSHALGGLGLAHPEGIEFNPDNNHLYIVSGPDRLIGETTTDGTLIRYIDFSTIGSKKAAGLAYAPASTNPAQKHLYIADRGVDNNTNPDPSIYNDGTLYEISFPGWVEFSAATYSVDEDAVTATITAILNVPSSDTVTVHYSASNGTATAGSDYTATSGTLTFDPGQTSLTFDVPILDDGSDEPDETVNLMLDSPSYATLTVVDDDPAPTVQFSTANFSVAESEDTAIITVFLSPASGQTVTIDYATSDGTATAGSDYTAASGTLTFNPNQTSRTFTVPILDDSLPEPDQTVDLTLSAPNHATLGSPSSAALTIVDVNDLYFNYLPIIQR